MNIILCDGKFDNTEGCKETAQYIARSEIDPIACVYYCCAEHKNSYETVGFIIEKL